MRVIATKTINAYRGCYPGADEPLKSWKRLIESREYLNLADLRANFHVELIKGDIYVFKKIKGNNYRLVCGIDFVRQRVFIKWFGTHKEYDKIKPAEVKYEYPPC
ncbi:MAG: type II toxin-antitoxin system HigB family toxin [Desulfarculaceae bacterium]|nr:type II toxin-antitoxin system HigB family toxin [Desulfarculaceae bacterium]MCF8073588.1 type II toxin-antitoxin system HigB family toxin [Desulfarculaceae bacterium]MCF8103745.1 type II toxin-antitoxin system HigB family toxin [Desulfarculaceae bacterium]MCF8115696.1 type II toxin-antitoxin system HigB family toxin [Desulfarculaceae bacterium]